MIICPPNGNKMPQHDLLEFYEEKFCFFHNKWEFSCGNWLIILEWIYELFFFFLWMSFLDLNQVWSELNDLQTHPICE